MKAGLKGQPGDQDSPLAHAAHKGDAEGCRLLLESGEWERGELDRALWYASRSDSAGCVLLLGRAGADPRSVGGNMPAAFWSLIAKSRSARAMLRVHRERGLQTRPKDILNCSDKGVAEGVARLMADEDLREAAMAGSKWDGLAAAELARREAAELRKAAAKPKRPASPRARL